MTADERKGIMQLAIAIMAFVGAAALAATGTPTGGGSNIDNEFFCMLPSSITVVAFDKARNLPIADTPGIHAHYPQFSRATFTCTSTIGRCKTDEDGHVFFSPGRWPGSGQILVKNDVTGGTKAIGVTVIPLPSLDIRLAQRRGSWSSSHDLYDLFLGVCEAMRTPCGIEFAEIGQEVAKREYLKRLPVKEYRNEISRRERRFIDINTRSARPRDVLDTIAAQAPDYRWMRHEGVLNVIPKIGRAGEAGGQSVLDQRLEAPLLLQNVATDKAVERVFKESGILSNKRRFAEGNLRPPFPRISVKLEKGTTLRHCLNDIVQADGGAIWVVYPRESDGAYDFDVRQWSVD